MLHRNWVVVQLYAIRNAMAALNETLLEHSVDGEWHRERMFLIEQEALFKAFALSVQYPPALPDDDDDDAAAS